MPQTLRVCDAAMLLSTAALLAPAVAVAQISLKVTPSRDVGVAPLAVFFDATSTTGLVDENYVGAEFFWDFGDPDSPHPTAKGFVAAHVFGSSGEYTVSVSVRDASGAKASATLRIEVRAFSGETYCVSAAGDDTSCAPGAKALASVSDVLANLGSNRRFLFRRGERFAFSEEIRPASGTRNLAFGAYPEHGAPPKLVPTGGQDYAFYPNSDVQDWRVVDIELDGEGASTQGLRSGPRDIKELLFLRVDFHRLGRGVNFQGISNGPVYFVDSELREFNATHNIYYLSYYLVLIGNAIVDTPSHNMYLADLYKGVITGNALGGSSSKTILRISNAASHEGYLAGDVVVSDNHFYTSSNIGLMLHLGPNSARSCCEGSCTREHDCPQHIRNVLVERNTFSPGRRQVQVGGGYSNLHLRNNIFETDSIGSILIDDHNSRHNYYVYMLSGTASENIRIAHNTFVASGAAPFVEVNDWANIGEEFCLSAGAGGGCFIEGVEDLNGEPTNHRDIRIESNIFYSLAAGEFPALTAQSETVLGELTVLANLYHLPNNQSWQNEVTNKDVRKVIGDPMFDGSEYGLSTGSPAIDKGSGIAMFEDFTGAHRDAQPDIGCREHGSLTPPECASPDCDTGSESDPTPNDNPEERLPTEPQEQKGLTVSGTRSCACRDSNMPLPLLLMAGALLLRRRRACMSLRPAGVHGLPAASRSSRV